MLAAAFCFLFTTFTQIHTTSSQPWIEGDKTTEQLSDVQTAYAVDIDASTSLPSFMCMKINQYSVVFLRSTREARGIAPTLLNLNPSSTQGLNERKAEMTQFVK
ncbi:hypothetical protein Y032_0344g3082 [Ancylostoma ceylanicum]|uniref:Uncharacterized protein n=1 Tax=Ancylostoma ceylanicum TaxID=53326 RepID=A0A016RXG7_9BILA|nr:hypothetical protein Y032_0344g3082 [Ancylostoma ceylanicum]